MDINVNDLNNILIDGQHAGCLTDVLLNHGSIDGLREAVLKACHDWHGDAIKGHQEVHAATVEKLKDEHKDALAKVQDELDDHKSQIQALGGTELAQKLRKDAELKAAHEARAKADARIAELTATS